MNFTIFWLQVLAGSWCPLSQVAGVPGLDTCYYTNVLILMITGECVCVAIAMISPPIVDKYINITCMSCMY